MSDKIAITDNIGRVEEIEESTSNPNVRPSLPFNPKITGPLFDPKEPVIERLAEAARPKAEQPVAGAYGIEHVNLDHLTNFPPESVLHDDRPIFQLGKAPLDGEYPLGSLLKHQSEQSVPLDASILKDLKTAQALAKDQAAIPKVQPPTSSEAPENNANVEDKEKGKEAEKGKSKRRFSIAGFFKRRSTTK